MFSTPDFLFGEDIGSWYYFFGGGAMFFGVVSRHITHNSTTLWLAAGSVVQNYSSKYRLLSIQFIELPYQESFKQFQKLFFLPV